MSIYEALAALLEYPGAGLPSALERCAKALECDAAADLEAFASAVRERTPGEMEELYTRTFDLQPDSCLYVGHQLFGEDWRRGMFMARLKHRYEESGFAEATEVPDYLPAVLRFIAAETDGNETAELLQDCVVPAAARLLHTLEEKSNPYAAVLRVLLVVIAPEGHRRFDTEDLSCRPFSSSPFPILP
jgi:nitrate reductase delta subunit